MFVEGHYMTLVGMKVVQCRNVDFPTTAVKLENPPDLPLLLGG